MILNILLVVTGIIALYGLLLYVVEMFIDPIPTIWEMWLAVLLMVPFLICCALKF